eukprot:6731418-Pyramimonas_sp.AAC.1
MVRRSRDDLLLQALSLLQYNRAGAGFRLKRSCWLGLPTHFKLGSGAGPVSYTHLRAHETGAYL